MVQLHLPSAVDLGDVEVKQNLILLNPFSIIME